MTSSVGVWTANYNCTISDFRPVELNGGYSPWIVSKNVVWTKQDSPDVTMFYDSPSNCWIARRAGSFWASNRCLEQRQPVVGLPPQDGWSQLKSDADTDSPAGRVECYQGPIREGGRWSLNSAGAIAIAVPFIIFLLSLGMILFVARNFIVRWGATLQRWLGTPQPAMEPSPAPPSPLPNPIRGRPELERRRSEVAADADSFLEVYSSGTLVVTRTGGCTAKRIPWTTAGGATAGSSSDASFPHLGAKYVLPSGVRTRPPPHPSAVAATQQGVKVSVEQRFGSVLLRGEQLRPKPHQRPPGAEARAKAGVRRWSAASLLSRASSQSSAGSRGRGTSGDEESGGVGGPDSGLGRVKGSGFLSVHSLGGVGRVFGGVFGAGGDGGSVGEKEACCVCLDRVPDVQLLPCKHRVQCRSCLLSQLVEWNKTTAPLCPICRGVIDAISLDDLSQLPEAGQTGHDDPPLSRESLLLKCADGSFSLSADFVVPGGPGGLSDRDKVAPLRPLPPPAPFPRMPT